MEQNLDNQDSIFRDKGEQKMIFFLVSMGVISVTYFFLFVVDFLPEAPSEESESETIIDENIAITDDVAVSEFGDEDSMTVAIDESDREPLKIIFDTLGKEIAVLNPVSNAVADLDTALLSGVVRHPDSADFGIEGTMFLFGHSSYLPKVFNKNFQAFNGIQDLEWGDTVRLQSKSREYVYRVDKVYQVKAADAEVEIEEGKSKLTLATCNTFGSKDDRYIVESTLIDSYEI